jgi:DNA mismatch endonuclease (patch repair protein)
MSKVKSKNSIPELMLRKVLWARGVRYRIHVKSLSGKPDLVMRKFKLVIFIDGGFWHGYHWEFKKERLKTNRAFWIPKIERNMQRDFFNNKVLREAGYTVMRFWDHEVKNNLERCVNQVLLYMEAVNNGKIPEVG